MLRTRLVVAATLACAALLIAPVVIAQGNPGGRDKGGACHQLGNGTYVYLEVGLAALAAHQAHGDYPTWEAPTNHGDNWAACNAQNNP